MTSSPSAPIPVREVLVVDDVPEILEMFRGLLRRVRTVDVHLTTEVDSQRALELARAKPFDLVLSDFRMRQVDGIEVLQAARTTNPAGHRLLMTGYNEVPTSLERVKGANVDGYLQKPLRSAELLPLLVEILGDNPETLAECRDAARAMEAEAAKGGRSLGVG